MLWLDHLIFGNGYGLKSPFFDNRFYWLKGNLYTFSFGFGVQLTSFQWFHPNAGERRHLCGRTFQPLYSRRRGPRVMVGWSMATMPPGSDNQLSEIRLLKQDLDAL